MVTRPDAERRQPDKVSSRESTERVLRVLLVVANAAARIRLTNGLEARGHAVCATACGDEARHVFGPGLFDAVLLDLVLPAHDGVAVLRALRAADPATPVVVAASFQDLESAVLAFRSGATDLLSGGPAGPTTDELLAKLNDTFAKRPAPEARPRSGIGLPVDRRDLAAAPPPVIDARLFDLPLREARAEFERRYLDEVLRRCHGNVSEAARRAGLARTFLHAKLHALSLDPAVHRANA